MKNYSLFIAVLIAMAPANAQSIRQSVITFCSAINKINAQGLSAAPGTVMAAMIAAKANQSAATYQGVWQISKAMAIPSCQRMW